MEERSGAKCGTARTLPTKHVCVVRTVEQEAGCVLSKGAPDDNKFGTGAEYMAARRGATLMGATNVRTKEVCVANMVVNPCVAWKVASSLCTRVDCVILMLRTSRDEWLVASTMMYVHMTVSVQKSGAAVLLTSTYHWESRRLWIPFLASRDVEQEGVGNGVAKLIMVIDKCRPMYSYEPVRSLF